VLLSAVPSPRGRYDMGAMVPVHDRFTASVSFGVMRLVRPDDEEDQESDDRADDEHGGSPPCCLVAGGAYQVPVQVTGILSCGAVIVQLPPLTVTALSPAGMAETATIIRVPVISLSAPPETAGLAVPSAFSGT
jgi:hypothetical protein